MSYFDPFQIVATARSAPFYAELYKSLPTAGFDWAEIPIATSEKINTAIYGDCAALMTTQTRQGMYYLSSGSTNQKGLSKTSFLGRDEWKAMVHLIAVTHWKNDVIRPNDTVLNIAPPGYASTLLVHDTLQQFPVPCSEIPLGADAGYPRIIGTCRQFKARVIAGLNSTLLGLADYLLRNGENEPGVERLLGGGELFYGAQLEMLRAAFPRAIFVPFCFASTDGGLMGYGDLDSGDNSYRVFKEACLLEILDPKTFEVIREPDRVGILVTTSLQRLAMPIIRYVVGDLAIWTEVGERARFSLCGRLTPFGYSIAGTTIAESDVASLVAALGGKLRISWFQLTLAGNESAPRIEVVLSLFGESIEKEKVEEEVARALGASIPQLAKAERSLSIQVKVTAFSSFEEQTRRKGRLLVDRRAREKTALNRGDTLNG